MNFEFIRECRLESDELQAMYDNVLQELELCGALLLEKTAGVRHHSAPDDRADLPDL